MFKILTIGILSYILYRLVRPAALQEPSPPGKPENEGEFIDYEEVDD